MMSFNSRVYTSSADSHYQFLERLNVSYIYLQAYVDACLKMTHFHPYHVKKNYVIILNGMIN